MSLASKYFYIAALTIVVLIVIAIIIAVEAHTGVTFPVIASVWIVLSVVGLAGSIYSIKKYNGPEEIFGGITTIPVFITCAVALIGICATNWIPLLLH